jgi:hypothetical protein
VIWLFRPYCLQVPCLRNSSILKKLVVTDTLIFLLIFSICCYPSRVTDVLASETWLEQGLQKQESRILFPEW